mmetsp:Transcript_44242/g.42939  ORF Transcript_44242/g.42939 Transcript_44242/m.42939 type:complete len:113 (-) Transcript_44242:13-351(-)
MDKLVFTFMNNRIHPTNALQWDQSLNQTQKIINSFLQKSQYISSDKTINVKKKEDKKKEGEEKNEKQQKKKAQQEKEELDLERRTQLRKIYITAAAASIFLYLNFIKNPFNS